MTCREFTEFIGPLLDGDLEAHTLAALREHVSACADCLKYFRNHLDMIRLARAALAEPDAHAPLDMPEDLMREILKR